MCIYTKIHVCARGGKKGRTFYQSGWDFVVGRDSNLFVQPSFSFKSQLFLGVCWLPEKKDGQNGGVSRFVPYRIQGPFLEAHAPKSTCDFRPESPNHGQRLRASVPAPSHSSSAAPWKKPKRDADAVQREHGWPVARLFRGSEAFCFVVLKDNQHENSQFRV